MKEMNFQGKLNSILTAGFFMVVGILLFKFLPMKIFGDDILFDASLHLVSAMFILYICWYFVDQNKSWRIPYLVFCFAVLVVVSFQRIYAGAHDDFGLLTGFLVGAISIFISRWGYFSGKFRF